MTNASIPLGSRPGSLREACGHAITEFAPDYPEMIVLDADVAGGTGFHHFRKAIPQRFIQCGIAEQNMIAMAAGMVDFGFIPVISSYAVFSTMRALEMVRNSIALPHLNVKITGSHVGVDAGPDGATHQCIEDIGIMRTIPGLVVLSPADAFNMRGAVQAMLEYQGPVYLRTGRSSVPDIYSSYTGSKKFTIGKSDVLVDGQDVCLLGTGVMVSRCLEARTLLASKGISASVINVSTIKPIDRDLILEYAHKTGAFVSAEDHNIMGGLGSSIAELLCTTYPIPIEMIGLQDTFAESGEPQNLSIKYKLMPKDIFKAAERVLGRKVNR